MHSLKKVEVSKIVADKDVKDFLQNQSQVLEWVYALVIACLRAISHVTQHFVISRDLLSNIKVEKPSNGKWERLV